jgi:hypothetical protein
METPDPASKLRMAPRETADNLSRQLQREQQTANLQREINLEGALAPFRVGSVDALNTVPLTRGLEDQIVFATPARLAEMLRRDELDAALVSVGFCSTTVTCWDGIAIASLGEVRACCLRTGVPEEAKEIS